MSRRNIFDSVSSVQPGRSVFDLSYDKKLTCDMGELIPVMCDEMVPGDKFDIGNQIVVRFQPLVAPILHEINAFVHYFFVPYRILWNLWEDFITGGETGADASVLPRWNPTNTAVGSLWDYLGFPTGIVPTDALPLDFVRSAYNRIYNEFYRDENLITEVAATGEVILKRAWEKDYFTSSLPWQQKGTAPALPISGMSSAVFNAGIFTAGASAPTATFTVDADTSSDAYIHLSGDSAIARANAKAALDRNTVDLSSATTFNVADLRLAFQIQKWMERNARAGSRYTEFLKAHFGVSPRDDRLQRPEYVGGSKSGVIVSEVLQTSKTESGAPQGNLAGHGLVADSTYVGSYHAKEYGLMMGIMSIMPRSAYSQGIDRQWLRRTKYDFYSPEFANLSEQAIERAELYASAVGAENRTIFGYQGRYDEMRVKRNMVVGKMRSTFNYWHLGREFGSAPLLNQSFIECAPSKRIFAVQTEPGLIVDVENRIKAIRPLPYASEPGLIDHM
nr:MAG: major capsid protein [Microvirus sp.]